MVSKLDCLLLQHVLWQRPDEAQRIADWLLAHLGFDDGHAASSYLFTGEERSRRAYVSNTFRVPTITLLLVW